MIEISRVRLNTEVGSTDYIDIQLCNEMTKHRKKSLIQCFNTKITSVDNQ